MYLMYYVGEDGNRVYTFKVSNKCLHSFFASRGELLFHAADHFVLSN
jgi:hypothetical protein